MCEERLLGKWLQASTPRKVRLAGMRTHRSHMCPPPPPPPPAQPPRPAPPNPAHEFLAPGCIIVIGSNKLGMWHPLNPVFTYVLLLQARTSLFQTIFRLSVTCNAQQAESS